jgi:hypothetical protein
MPPTEKGMLISPEPFFKDHRESHHMRKAGSPRRGFTRRHGRAPSVIRPATPRSSAKEVMILPISAWFRSSPPSIYQCFTPGIVITISSRCHLSPAKASLGQIWFANVWPNFCANWRTAHG